VFRAARTNLVKIRVNDSATMIETLESVLAPLLIIGSFCNLGKICSNILVEAVYNLGRISLAYMLWPNGAVLRTSFTIHYTALAE